MRTQSILSDVTIQVSSKPVLTMPELLRKQLGVRKGEKVSVQVRKGTLRVRRNGKRKLLAQPRNERRSRRTAKITDLIGAISVKPGAPQINFEEQFSHHGYEQLERPGRKGF